MRIPLAAFALLVLTSCSGGEGVEPPTLDSLAELVGCTDLVPDEPVMEGADESGSCRLSGSDVTLLTFATADDRDAWLDTSAASDAADGVRTLVSGNNWVGVASDAATLDALGEHGEVVTD